MKIVLALLMALSMAACSLREHGLVDNPYPEIKPIDPLPAPTPIARTPGSLYSPQTSIANFVTDSRAYRVNDIVIVNIAESTSATSSATTETDRTSTNSFKVPNLFGIEKTHTQFFGAGTTDGTVFGTETTHEHEGDGTTQRSGIFTGSLAARVTNVLPNRYLVIQGYKDIQVNGEKMRLYLSGMVNPLMITAGQTINSNQIADLQVRFGGEGIVAAHQNPGLFYRIINFLWPF